MHLLLLLLLILFQVLSIEALSTGSWVLLTELHWSLNASLLSGTKICPNTLYFPYQIDQLFELSHRGARVTN